MPRPWMCLAALGLLCGLGSPSRGQAVAFQPTIGSALDGVMLPVTPVVSADRRYVRLSTNPQFFGFEGFDTYSVPAAVSGGGGGGGLPGGAVRGMAGLNGVSDGVASRANAGRNAPGYSAGDLPYDGLPPGADLMAVQGPGGGERRGPAAASRKSFRKSKGAGSRGPKAGLRVGPQ